MTERIWVPLHQRQPTRLAARHRAKAGAGLLDGGPPQTGDAVGEPVATPAPDPVGHRSTPDVPRPAPDRPARGIDRGRC